MWFILKYWICQKFKNLRCFLLAFLLNRSLINCKFCLFCLCRKSSSNHESEQNHRNHSGQGHLRGQVWAMSNKARFSCNSNWWARHHFQPRQRDFSPISRSGRGILWHILQGTWLLRNKAQNQHLSHVNHQHLCPGSFACVATETSLPEHRPQAHRGVLELAAKLD